MAPNLSQSRLIAIKSFAGSLCELIVIYVPECGARLSKNNSIQSLPTVDGNRVHLYLFEYTLEKQEIWPTLIRRGDELVEILKDALLNAPLQVAFCHRIVFVCHGLGGIVVKRTLTALNDRFWDIQCQKLFSLYSGTVFLGTPHPSREQKESWIKLSLVLRATSKFSKAFLARAEMEVAIVANVSEKFQQSSHHEPIISVHETRRTKISEGLFKSRREVLIDAFFASIGSRNEMLLASDADHADVANIVEGTRVFEEVNGLLHSTFRRPLDLNATTLRPVPPASILPDNDYWASEIADNDHQPKSDGNLSANTPAGATLDSNESPKSDVMAALIDFSSTARKPKLPCKGSLRTQSKNPDFFGRVPTLKQIQEALKPSDNQSADNDAHQLRSFALYGFGGVGKTQIAIQFAHSRAHLYDAIFWVQADSTDKLSNSFKEIVTSLQLLQESDATDPVVNRNIVMEWLSTPVKGDAEVCDGRTETVQEGHASWLLIFDNADKPELLRDFWPVSGNGSVLVTSRDPLAKTHLHTDSYCDLQPFEREDAALFLEKLSGNALNTSDEQKNKLILSDRLGGFPLALVHVAAIMRRQALTMTEMLGRYDKQKFNKEIYDHTELSPHDKYTHTLSTVWGIEDLGGSSLRLLDTIAFLDPDGIDESIVEDRELHEEAADLQSSQESYEYARTNLIGASLIKREKEHKRLTIHRVVQEGTRNRMSPQKLATVFAHVTNILLKTWLHEPEEKFTHLSSLWAIANIVSTHAAHLQSLYDRKRPDIDAQTMFNFARLMQKNGWFLVEAGYSESARPFLDLALALCNELPSGSYRDMYSQDERVLLADVLFGLATLASHHYEQEEAMYYAKWHFEVRMDVENKKLAFGRHAGLAYTEIGLAYLINNRFEDAIEANQAGRALLVKLPQFKEGRYWPDFAILHEVIALIALDRDQEAIPLLEEALAFRERRFGPNDTQSFKLGFYMQLFALIHLRRGDEDASFQCFQKALLNYRITVGDHFFRTGEICVKLADHHAAKNEIEAASIYYGQAEKCLGTHGFTRPELALVKYKKLRFLRNIGNGDATEGLAREVKELYIDIVSAQGGKVVDDPQLWHYEQLVKFWVR